MPAGTGNRLKQLEHRGTILALMVLALTLVACTTVSLEEPAGISPAIRSGLERGGWQNRYLQYNGTFDYYVGFDLQQLHADTNIDYVEKLNFLAEHGVNKVRIWLHSSWFGLPGQGSYPETGKILFPWKVDPWLNKFDLDQWDPEFWERTKDFLAQAASRKIIVEISLFSVQEPRNYFNDLATAYPFNHRNNLQNFGRSTDRNGGFMRGFYDLNYKDNNLALADYHKAYIDKTLEEFESFDHIYYELINESPGEPYWVKRDLPHKWMKHWMKYLASKTNRLVTTHNSGFMNLKNGNEKQWTSDDFNSVGQKYWNESYFDGFNFHLYSTDPNDISMALSGYQQKGKLLICNEGGTFYEIDRSKGYPNFELEFNRDQLYGEIRHAWGMMTSGGYYSIYFGPVPQLGDKSSTEAAKAMQAMRNIVEMTTFQNMRPEASSGDDFDSLVTQGPATNWQTIADEGEDYIVYFWGDRSRNSAKIDLPAGKYEYFWMETRTKKPPLKSGSINMEMSGLAAVEPPAISTWRQGSGIVLVIVNQADSDVTDHIQQQ